MSGPKGYGYSVVSAAELRRREDAARAGRCEQHVITLAGLTGQLRHLGAPTSEVVPEPAAKTHESLIAWEASLQRAIADAEDRIRTESGRAILRRLGTARGAVDVTGVSLGGGERAARSAPRATPDQDDAGPAAGVAKVVRLIAGLRDESEREALALLAERVARTTGVGQADGDLLTLKTRAAAALRLQDLRDLAAQAALGIAHVTTPEAAAVRARAAAVTSAEGLAEVRSSAAEVAAREARRADAEFVEAALEESLRELGFALGEGFELADLDRSVAIADHPDHPGYGVRVQLNPANGMVYTRVVAERPASPAEDARAEAETCDKVHALAGRLAEKGVAAELKSERQPGEAPVELIEAAPAGAPRRRRRTSTAPRARGAR